MEGILPQPAAQAQDVGQAPGRQRRRRLRPVEQRMRRFRGTGARMGERAPVEELGVARVLCDRLAERIAGIPRRAALQVLADALAGLRGRGVVRSRGAAVHGVIPLAGVTACAAGLFPGDALAPDGGGNYLAISRAISSRITA